MASAYVPGEGVILNWHDGFEVIVDIDDAHVRIRANAAGLRSLADHLLALADPQCPAGQHVHLDDSAALEPGSAEMIVERS